MSNFNKIVVIGLGYIGLPTAAVLASRGKEVIGVDVNRRAVEIINTGRTHIVEPDLADLVGRVVKDGKLRAVTIPEPGDAFVIAVPTPFKDGHKPDLSYIEAAARSIAPVLKPGNLVILESTSPVSSTEKLSEWLAAERSDLRFPHQAGENADIRVAYCPERVLPGRVLHELIENDRIIGGLTPPCTEAACELYRIFVEGECLRTNSRTAELAKLTENSFRDVNIAFANELSLICGKLDINVWELVRLANHHPRVNVLQPGPGVGGHCIAVDPWFIVDSAPEQARLIRTAREVNDRKPHYVIDQITRAAHDFDKPVVACLGLAFKPDIDDLRESPAVEIVKELATRDIGDLRVVEPNIDALPEALSDQPRISLVSAEEALSAANVVAMLVNHKAFYGITLGDLQGKAVIDTRGVWQ